MGKQNLLVSKEPLVLRWFFFFFLYFCIFTEASISINTSSLPLPLLSHSSLRNLLTHTLLKLSYEVGTLLSGNMPKVHLIQSLYSNSIYSPASLLFTAWLSKTLQTVQWEEAVCKPTCFHICLLLSLKSTNVYLSVINESPLIEVPWGTG